MTNDKKELEFATKLLKAIKGVDGGCGYCEQHCIDGFIREGLVDEATILPLACKMDLGQVDIDRSDP